MKFWRPLIERYPYRGLFGWATACVWLFLFAELLWHLASFVRRYDFLELLLIFPFAPLALLFDPRDALIHHRYLYFFAVANWVGIFLVGALVRRWWLKDRRSVTRGAIAIATAAALVLLGASYYFNSHNTVSIASAAATYGEAVTNAAKQKVPALLILGLGEPKVIQDLGDPKGTSVTYRRVDVLLINPLDVPITYRGYRMDSWSHRPPLGQIGPFFHRETKATAEDEWKNDTRGRCGTGAGDMVVPPGRAGRFQAHLDLPAHAARIGLACLRPGETWSQAEKIWSEPIELSQK